MGMKTNFKYEILTPDGFKPFYGVRALKRQGSITLKTTSASLTCSPGHRILTAAGWQRADALCSGDELAVDQDFEPLLEISSADEDHTYFEPVEVQGHAYVANGIINHNCEFLSSDALLINSIRLNQLRWKQPLWESMGFKFWKPQEEIGGPGKIYMVAADMATGTGGDYTVVEVFDFPGLTQVAEFRSNEVNIPLIYAKIKWVLKMLSEFKLGGRSEVLWTFERNGVGEGMSSLYFNDENQPDDVELFSDHPQKFGVYTNGKAKNLAALQLKTLVEKGNGIEFNSEMLIAELKNFVAKGGSYEAKAGMHDDTVMAVIIMMRLLKRLSEYNDEAFKTVNEYVDPNSPIDDSDSYVPFAMS